MSFGQFLSILLARWKIALLVFLFSVGSVVGISLLLPKKYTADAAIILDIKSPDPIAGVLLPSLAMPSYMATQVDIIQSNRVALKVVKQLKLIENAALREQWLQATKGKGSIEAWVADALQKNLIAKPSRESNVIQVSFKGSDPRFAAVITNTFVQAYLDTVLELKIEPAKAYSGFFDERSKGLRENVERAQTRLSAYQKIKGIVATDERLDIETTRLNELSNQLVALQAIAVDSSSRQSQANKSSEQMQEVLQNPLVSSLRGDLARQEARLREVSSKLGANHPQILELQANINELAEKIAQEIGRVTGGVTVSNSINRQREIAIRASLDAQRNKVFKLKESRDEFNVLQRDVENSQKAYDIVVSRGTQTTLESQTQQTNAAILNPATEPPDPSSPKMLFNTAAGLVLGTLLALGTVLINELVDRRVRSVHDITALTELPVIGLLPGPDKGKIFRRNQPSVLQKRILRKLPSLASTKP
jgi:polysaccharide biosynthesis transport protein